MAPRTRRITLPDDDELLTTAEVARQLRITQRAVYPLIRSGRLPAIRIWRRYRVTKAAFRAFLAAPVVTRG